LPLFPLLLVLLMSAIALHISLKGIKSEYYLGAVLLVLMSVWSVQSLTQVNSLGLKSKVNLMQSIKKLTDAKAYYLDAKGSRAYEGYRYLAQWQGITPAQSYMDPHFGWLYGNSGIKPQVRLTIYHLIDAKSRSEIDLGSIEDLYRSGNYFIGYETIRMKD